MARGRYTTKQQVAIEAYLKQNKGESYTVDMLCSELSDQGMAIGKATVYRCLERLVSEELLIAVPDVELGCIRYCCIDDKPAVMYLMCDTCHKLKPLYCNAIESFISHVADEHDFRPDNQKTIMYGICKECVSGE